MSLAAEARVALRSLVARPVTSLVIVATLGLGLGATAAWLDVLDLVLWREPRAKDPASLVQVYTWHHHAFIGPWGLTSLADYRAYRESVTTLSGLAAFRSLDLASGAETAEGERETLPAYAVSGNYFEVLGLSTSRGRPLVPSDDRVGAEAVAVLSHRVWKRRFGGDPDTLGRSLPLGGRSFRVVGIGQPDFAGELDAQVADVFVPIASLGETLDPEERLATLIGRRRPGVGVAAVQAELARLADDLERRQPAAGLPRRLTVVRARLAHPIDRRDLAAPLRIFGAGAALLLLLAGANVSNLLLGEALARGREAGIRKALGGGTWDLMRRPLLEALLLAAGGAGLGLLLATWSRRLLALYIGPELTDVLRFETRSLLLLGLAAALVALLVTLVPAWVARRTPALTLLKGTASGGGPASPRLLAAVQVGLCVVLLTATGLLGMTLHNLLGRDLGFETSNLVRARLELAPEASPDEGRRQQRRFGELAVAAAPIAAAGRVQLLPPFILDASMPFRLPGDDAPRLARFNVVDGAYFETLGIPLLSGRLFEDRDGGSGTGVAIVNRALAERLWPGAAAVGRTLRLEQRREAEVGPELVVVGVVANTVQYDVRQEAEPVLFLSREQRYRSEAEFVVRTAGPTGPAVEALRAAAAALGPEARLTDVQTFASYRWDSAVRERLQAASVALLGGAALFLALLGVFGVMSQSVTREARAIGVRIAVGAGRADVVRWIVGRGARLALLGAAGGVLGAVGAIRLLEGSLYGIGPAQGLAVGTSVVTLVVGAAALSAYLPSRRAATLDPSTLLRSET